MICSSRHILDMRSRLLAISPEQWLLLALGMIAGCAVWILFNRRIVHRILSRLQAMAFKSNATTTVESLIGGTVFLVNAGLVYVATLIANFFLFSFAVVGLLVGAWITIPASFE